jgi:alkylated DNA nucleotide flippase Atl1
MASSRASLVAEVLWELKRADKVATYSAIATRAGFSAGTGGRTMRTCLKTVRRDWPHLHWWRAISDDGAIKPGSEQEKLLKDLGLSVAPDGKDKEKSTVDLQNECVMVWTESAVAVVVDADE